MEDIGIMELAIYGFWGEILGNCHIAGFGDGL